MNGKTIRNILIVYLVILLAIIMIQLPKSDLSADEPSYKVEVADVDLNKAIVMNVNSPVVFVGSKQHIIDSEDVDIVPKIVNDSTYVPIQFFKNILGSHVSWDGTKKETAIRYNNKAIVFTNNSDIVRIIDSDTDREFSTASAPMIVRDRMYVPLRVSLESFGKYVIYKNGLIVITDNEVNLADKVIDELLAKTKKLPVVGSEYNLELLIGKPGSSRSRIEYDEVAVEESMDMAATNSSTGSSMQKESASLTDSDLFADSPKESGDYSKTNVQVEGVDEGDVIKTDGEYVYFVKDNNVQIARAYPPEKMTVMSVIEPMKEYYGKNCMDPHVSELYISGGSLIVVGTAYLEKDYSKYEVRTETTTQEETDNSQKENKDVYVNEPQYGYNRQIGCTFADIYDITDKSNPQLKKQIITDGDYLSSRLTNNCLYMVSNVSIDDLVCSSKYIPPAFYDSSANKEPVEIEFKDICYIPERTSRQYMNITGADLDKLNEKAHVYTTIASGSDIYMSLDNLYAADTRNNTEIYKYKLDGGKVEYSAHGKVDGILHNQFSMDENNGYFRITTSEYSNGEKSNNLFILDDKLDKVSEIRDIAPGESIYSTRFMGSRAYMVTFETVDPLFVIDVSDVQSPKILGALKIPGYSDYLHPYDENHLIGIGKDTFVYEDMAYYKGMKLSMFDVTDVENPIEMFNEIIGDRGTYSEVLDNHRALLFDKEKNILAFPVSIYTIDDSEKNRSAEPTRDDLQYGIFSFQGLLRYSIDMDNGFNLESKTTHFTNEDMLKAGNYSNSRSKEIQRGLMIGDYLYTVSDYMLMAENIENERTMGKVEWE